jgi:signal transduction histidine kinase
VDDDGDTIKCQISDTGIGIRKEDLLKVFEPFSNIKKPSTIQTAGIGLSITKGIVEAHGGKIWAESEGEGKGATFTFTLPKPKEDD